MGCKEQAPCPKITVLHKAQIPDTMHALAALHTESKIHTLLIIPHWHTHIIKGICGFFQHYFYTLKRDKPEEWKCQPHRFLSRANEIHEIVVGTVNMTLAAFGSGILTCWIVNGSSC